MSNPYQHAPGWTPEQEDFDHLSDNISLHRAEAEKKYDDLSMEQVKHLRRKAKEDLFFLCYGILGYDLLSPGLHGHLCSWLEATRSEQYRVLLLPRGHYKSTVKTIGESIQMALPNDADLQDHPWNLGPDIKLLIAHENRESASRFLFEIAEAFLRKPLMLALFPECVSSKAHQRINKWELELPRNTHHKEPTFDTIGAGGAAQGRHYSHLALDDLIGEAARDSETVMKTTLTWFDNVNSLLTRVKYDGWDLVGTRWSWKDVYSHAMDVYGVNIANSVLRCMDPRDVHDGVASVYARGAFEREQIVFPEEFSPEFLERMRRNPRVYAAQYANNPKESGLGEFDTRWLKFYNVTGSYLYIFEKGKTRRVNMWDLDRTILIDPSMGERAESDESGVIVTGTDKDMNVYILETIKERLKPPELIDLMFELHRKWNPRVISMEEVVFSGLFRYWFEDKCRDMGVYPTMYPYKPGGKRSKKARIKGLGPYFSAGQVYLQEGMHDLRDEYEWFGITDSEHLLDALAQGPEVWSPGARENLIEEQYDAEQMVLEHRSALTGY